MKNILITGGLGFIGNNLIKHLLERGGYQIRVFDKDTADKAIAYNISDVDFQQGDMRDKQALRKAVEGMDCVVHLAAHTRVIDSMENPQENFDVNVIGTFDLLMAIRDFKVPYLVNASTGGAILGEAPSPVHEDMPARPLAPYGAGKLAVEGYCSAFAGAYGLKAASLRFSNIYGPYSCLKGSVVPLFMRQILNQENLLVYGDGEQTRDFLYSEDLAKSIIDVIEQEPVGVFQLGTGDATSLNTLLNALRDKIGDEFKSTIEHVPLRVGEVIHNYSDISLARKTFNYNPTTSLDEGIVKTWAWFVDWQKQQKKGIKAA